MKNIIPLIDECCLCLENHKIKDCSILNSPYQINDTSTLCKAYATLPSVLSMEKTCDGKEMIRAKSFLSKGTRFGPVDSLCTNQADLESEFPLKIILDRDRFEYLNTEDKTVCNWMCLVQPASCFQDCNLVAYQNEFCVYFSVLKNIEIHTELKVYYAPFYAEKICVQFSRSNEPTDIMEYNDVFDDIGSPDAELRPEDMMEGMNQMPSPISSPTHLESTPDKKGTLDVTKLPAKSLGVLKDRSEWKCSMCSVVFTSIPLFAKHLQGHYTSIMKQLRYKKKANPSLNSVNENLSSSDLLLSGVGVFSVACQPPAENIGVPTTVPTSLNLGDELQVMSDLNPSVPMLYLGTRPMDSTTAKPSSVTKEIFTCDICTKKFDRMATIVRHLKKHAGDFHCARCGKVFARKEILQLHECLDLVYACDQCPETFTHVKLLRQHKSDHLKRRGKYTLDGLSCKLCPHQSDTIASFIQHIRSHDSPTSVTVGGITCPICGRTYSRSRIFYRKHLSSHSAFRYCHQCKGVFSGTKTYENHWCFTNKDKNQSQAPLKIKTKLYRRSYWNDIVGVTSSGRFTCDHCLVHFDSEVEFRIHKSQHEEAEITRSTSFLCQHCGNAYEHETSLSKHIHRMHASEKVTCEISSCRKQFRSQHQLFLHIQRHKDNTLTYDKPGVYPCTYCGKVFAMKKYRTNHIVIKHTEDHKHSCDLCGQKFKIKSHLNSHVKHVHRNEPKVRRQTYRYNCHLCKKTFVKKSVLRNHIQSHSVIVSYSCLYCPKTTLRGKVMTRHLAAVHADKKSEWNREKFLEQLMIVKDLTEKGANRTEGVKEPEHKSDEPGNDVNSIRADIELTHPPLLSELDQEDNLLSDDPMKLFDLHTESNSNAAILRQTRELPGDSITSFDLSVFYNDQSVEMPYGSSSVQNVYVQPNVSSTEGTLPSNQSSLYTQPTISSSESALPSNQSSLYAQHTVSSRHDAVLPLQSSLYAQSTSTNTAPSEQSSLYTQATAPSTQPSLYVHSTATSSQSSLYAQSTTPSTQSSLFAQPTATSSQSSLYTQPTVPSTLSSLYSQSTATSTLSSLYAQRNAPSTSSSLYVQSTVPSTQSSRYAQLTSTNTVPSTNSSLYTQLTSTGASTQLSLSTVSTTQSSLYVQPTASSQSSVYVKPTSTHTILPTQSSLYVQVSAPSTQSSLSILQSSQSSLYAQPTISSTQSSLHTQPTCSHKVPSTQTSLFTQQAPSQLSVTAQPMLNSSALSSQYSTVAADTTVFTISAPSGNVSNLLPVSSSQLSQLCIPDSVSLPLRTIQTSDVRISTPLYASLPVSDSFTSDNLVYVILDPASATGTNVVTLDIDMSAGSSSAMKDFT